MPVRAAAGASARPATHQLVRAYLSRLDRQHLACVATVAIELLDRLDGDPDLEPEEAEPDF